MPPASNDYLIMHYGSRRRLMESTARPSIVGIYRRGKGAERRRYVAAAYDIAIIGGGINATAVPRVRPTKDSRQNK
jgi:hypothetical protein